MDIADAALNNVVYRSPDVRPDRGKPWNSNHSSHSLQAHLLKTGSVRIRRMKKGSILKPAHLPILAISGGSSNVALISSIGAKHSPMAVMPMPGKTIYTCPMHPEVQQDHPGNCPKCGMTLEPMAATASPIEGENAELH